MEPEHGEIIGVHEHGLFAGRDTGRLSEWLSPRLPPGSLAEVGKSTSKPVFSNVNVLSVQAVRVTEVPGLNRT